MRVEQRCGCGASLVVLIDPDKYDRGKLAAEPKVVGIALLDGFRNDHAECRASGEDTSNE